MGASQLGREIERRETHSSARKGLSPCPSSRRGCTTSTATGKSSRSNYWILSICSSRHVLFHGNDERASARSGRCLPHLRNRVLRAVGTRSRSPAAEGLQGDPRLPHGYLGDQGRDAGRGRWIGAYPAVRLSANRARRAKLALRHLLLSIPAAPAKTRAAADQREGRVLDKQCPVCKTGHMTPTRSSLRKHLPESSRSSAIAHFRSSKRCLRTAPKRVTRDSIPIEHGPAHWCRRTADRILDVIGSDSGLRLRPTTGNRRSPSGANRFSSRSAFAPYRSPSHQPVS